MNSDYTGGKVPFWQKVAFGIGGMCNDFMGNTIMVLTVPIFNIALGLDAALVGLAISIPRLWDAVTDPVMGNISDNTRCRFGRRRPYIFAGSFIGGILFSLIWFASPEWSQGQLFTYFIAMAILFYTAYTLFIVPYNGLASELTMDVNDRTRVMAFRAFFGSLAGLITPWAYKMCFIKSFGANEIEAVRVVGVIFGILIIITGLIPAIGSRENPAAVCQPKIKILQALKITFSNRPFLIMMGMVFFILMGIYLVYPLQLYIGIYYLFDGDKAAAAHLGGIAGTVYATSALFATPVIAWCGTRFGKVRTLLCAQGFLIFANLLTWVFYTPACPYLSLVSMVMMSPAMACVWILLGSMLADVCDYDELSTKMRREGMYGAVYSFISKSGVAAVLAASGFLANWAGFDPALEIQTEQTVLWIRIMFAVVPALFVAVALICTKCYPLTEAKMRDIREELNLRKQTDGCR